MGSFDGIIVVLLYGAFAVYLVMGLTLSIMGGLYMSDAGAVGATGIYMMLFGLVMLIIGGAAIFANLRQMWQILAIVELVNLALFLVRVQATLLCGQVVLT
jgi:hypothetical protein